MKPLALEDLRSEKAARVAKRPAGVNPGRGSRPRGPLKDTSAGILFSKTLDQRRASRKTMIEEAKLPQFDRTPSSETVGWHG
jgi:hypothetical protein